MNINDAVKAYIAIRDRKAALKAKHAEELRPYDEALTKLEGQVLSIMFDTGMESIRTESGTAYKTTRTSVTIADKSAFMDYIKSHQDFEMLDVRANKTAVEGYLAEHQDLPPGVNIVRENAVNFRRA